MELELTSIMLYLKFKHCSLVTSYVGHYKNGLNIDANTLRLIVESADMFTLYIYILIYNYITEFQNMAL